MSKIKLLRVIGISFALVMVLLIPATIYAGTLATFENPALTECSLAGFKVSGKLTIRQPAYVEEYVNDTLLNSFTGPAGSYGGYVSFNGADAYPYTWRTVITFRNSSGEIIEQYALEGDCSAEDTGTATFKEIELDSFQINIS